MYRYKLIMVLIVLSVGYEVQASKRPFSTQYKQACPVKKTCPSKRCALKPRTRRNQCPPPEYGLDCDSCCYQAYGSPGYTGFAFRPYYSWGYFGRRPGNFNFTF